MLRTGARIELVGLTTSRQTMSWPVEMPPRMPPAWLAEEGGRAVLHAHLVGIVLAAHGGGGEAVADLHALHGVDAHQRLGEVGIELVVDRVAQSHARCRTPPPRSPRRTSCRACARRRDSLPSPGRPGGRGTRRDCRPVAAQSHLPRSIFWLPSCTTAPRMLTAVAQDLAGDGAGGDANGGLARRLAAAAAIVAHAVFLEVGVVGVGRAELVLDLANSRASAGRHCRCAARSACRW